MIRLLPALLTSLAIAAQDAPPKPKPSNLLVITLDTTRRDFMGFLGKAPSPTPNLDRLAEQCCVFEDAYTVAPLTLPAHSTLFTGLYPRTHGVHENSSFKLPKSARTLAEVLKEHGFATGAAVAAFVLDPMFGLDQGFDRYDAPTVGGNARMLITQRLGAAMVAQAAVDLPELAAHAPFFYWVHFYDPHFPYAPPGSVAPKPGFVTTDNDPNSRPMYEAEIRYMDEQVGRLLELLKQLRLDDDLVILVAADHGESLRDGLEPSHGFFLFDPVVRIPMLVRAPGLAPRRVAEQASLVDAMPTLLDLLGVAAPELRFDGANLAPLLRDPTSAAPERALLLESWYAWINHGWAPLDGCVVGPLKYLRSRRLELYDRAVDPDEKSNVFDAADPRSQSMQRRLATLIQPSDARLERDAITLSGRDLARLMTLGYAAAVAREEEPPNPKRLDDAYEKLPVIRALEEVLRAQVEGDRTKQIELLRGLVKAEPQSSMLHAQLGIALVNEGPGNLDEADEQLLAALRIDPKNSRAHYATARAAEERVNLLNDQIKKLREQGKGQEELRELLVKERQQTRRAIRFYKACLEFEPHFPAAIERLAHLLHDESDRMARLGELDDARASLDQSIELLTDWLAFMPEAHPDRPKVVNNLAVLKKRHDELEKMK